MKEQNAIEQPAALTDIPMLAEYDRELTEAVVKPEPDMTGQQPQSFGLQLRRAAVQWRRVSSR